MLFTAVCNVSCDPTDLTDYLRQMPACSEQPVKPCMVTLHTYDSGKVSTASAVCSWSLTQSCLTLCHTVDCSAPGSSVHRIFQVRILWQVGIFYSRGPSQPRDGSSVSCASRTGWWILYHCSAWEAQASVTTLQNQHNITCTSEGGRRIKQGKTDKAPSKEPAWRLRTNDLGNINCHFYVSPWPVMSIPLELPIKNGLD